MSYSRLRETYDNEKFAEVYTGGGLLSPPPRSSELYEFYGTYSPPGVSQKVNFLCMSLNIGKPDYQDNTNISGLITINVIITFLFPKGIVHIFKNTHYTSIFEIKNTIEQILMFTGFFTYSLYI